MNIEHSKFRWVIFVSVLVTYLFMSSQRTAPGLITNQLMADFGTTAATIGLVASIQFLVYTSLQIPMGMMSDRYGPNFFLIVGTLLAGVGTIIYSQSTDVFVLFVGRTLTGIGDATVWVNLVLVLSRLFSAKEFTRLIGVAGMTGSLGFLFATVPFSAWIALLGWRGVFLFVGVLFCFCGILLYAVLVKIPKQPLFVKNNIHNEKISVSLRKVFSNRQAWSLFMCHFGIVGGYIGYIGSWAVPYGMEVYGMSRLDASELIMVSLIGALIGAPLVGWISSRLGVIKRPYIVFHMIMLVCWASFLLFKGQPSIPLLFTFFFIIGFSFGANALTFAVVRQTVPSNEAGIVSGFANTGGFLSAVLLPSIFGAILDYSQSVTGDVSHGYFYGFIILVLFSIVGLVGVFSIKESQTEVAR